MKKQTWNSVKDILPDNNRNVLVVVNSKICIGDFEGVINHQWWINDTEGYHKSMAVTHWMELPELPVE